MAEKSENEVKEGEME